MVLLIVVLVILSLIAIVYDARRDRLIENSRERQVEIEKSFRESHKKAAIAGMVLLLASVLVFLFCNTAVIMHYDDGFLTKAHDARGISWSGFLAYVMLSIGALLFLLGLKGYANHDLKMILFQAVSDSEYEAAQKEALEAKIQDEAAAQAINKKMMTKRRNKMIVDILSQVVSK